MLRQEILISTQKKERQRTYDLERNYIFFIFTEHIIHTQSICMNDEENGTKKKKRTGTTSILLQFRLRGLFAYSTALAVMRAIRELRHFAWKGAESSGER